MCYNRGLRGDGVMLRVDGHDEDVANNVLDS